MSKEKIIPPKLIGRFLEWFCPDHLYEGIHGDLNESFEVDLKNLGARVAVRRYY